MQNRVEQIRKQTGWSQQQLGDMIGVTKSTISRIESGVMDPTHDMQQRIAAALDETPSRLFAVVKCERCDGLGVVRSSSKIWAQT